MTYRLRRSFRYKSDAMASPSIFVGYNSIRFDEEMLRHALFQTLHPAYWDCQDFRVSAGILGEKDKDVIALVDPHGARAALGSNPGILPLRMAGRHGCSGDAALSRRSHKNRQATRDERIV